MLVHYTLVPMIKSLFVPQNQMPASFADFEETKLQCRLASGDEVAYRAFFEAYQPKLNIYIFKMVKSKEITEELVLDIFLKIWVKKGIFLEVQDMNAFLYRMAVNKALDFLRTASNERNVRRALSQKMYTMNAHITHDGCSEKEYEQQLKRCLQHLPDQQRLILNLSRSGGLSNDEIAAQLNLSKYTVKNHIVAALKTLRHLIRTGRLILLISCLMSFYNR
jgi:RNA polymerase sigma-70 factor (family 1)